MEDSQMYETLPIVKYDVNLATISKLREKYMPLEITDLNDKEQFDAIHDGRMVLVRVRTTIEKQRKSNNEGARKYIKDNDAAAKELLAEANPIETHLKTEEDKVVKEKERIKAEEEREAAIKIQTRINALFDVKVVLPFQDVAAMSDDEYNQALTNAQAAFKREQDRLKKEQEDREAEEARLTKMKEELDRKQAEQDAIAEKQADKQAALDAAKASFERSKQAEQEIKNRAEFEKKAKAEAKAKAEKDAKAKAEKEAKAKIAKEKAEKAEAKRQEALKPDKWKLLAWAETIGACDAPEVKSPASKELAEEAHAALNGLVFWIKSNVEEL